MKEQHWLQSTDAHELLHHLKVRTQSSDRKYQLLAVSLFWCFWVSLPKVSRKAVELAETSVSGNLMSDEMQTVVATIDDLHAKMWITDATNGIDGVPSLGALVINLASGLAASRYPGSRIATEALNIATDKGLSAPIVPLLRDVFGNPFRPVVFDSSWRTDTVTSLARGMYESRNFSAMPILADALQDAGCDNDLILTHCRDEKAPHVRGCWVVDLVLNKS